MTLPAVDGCKPFWLYVHGTGAETENAISWLKKLTGLNRWNTTVVASGVSITPGAESLGKGSAGRPPTPSARTPARQPGSVPTPHRTHPLSRADLAPYR